MLHDVVAAVISPGKQTTLFLKLRFFVQVVDCSACIQHENHVKRDENLVQVIYNAALEGRGGDDNTGGVLLVIIEKITIL